MARLRDLHAELQRRKVYRVAIAYAAVAFVVWQVADIAFPSLGLPDAAVTFVLALTVLAFPLAIVLAWAYEVRPEPVVPEQPSSASPMPGISSSEQGTVVDRSVAVLPFENMSTEAESEYFADGIAEELTLALGRTPSLRVAARTSAFSFRGERVDVREIGRRLNVGHIVEGSLRRSGNRLRITAQLVDCRDGYHVWSDRYEREMDDVFAIQDEIVEAVVVRLRERLAEERQVPPQMSRANDLNAYDLYLRARHALRSFDGDTVLRAEELVDRAIEIDPTFAAAHAVHAIVLTTQAIGFFRGRTGDLLARARMSADRALDIDPELPEAHLAKALTLLYHDWSFVEARRALDRAMALNPSYADVHRWSEFYWTYVERDYDEAMGALRAAAALDPLDTRIPLREAAVNYIFGHLDEAERRQRALVERDPDSLIARIGLIDTLTRMGRLDEAAELSSLIPVDDATPDVFLGVPGLVLANAGRLDDARRRLAILQDRREEGYALPFWRAVIHAGLGEIDDAFQLLGEAIEERDGGLLYLSVVPPVAGFQDDPRFGGILREIGLGHLVPEGVD